MTAKKKLIPLLILAMTAVQATAAGTDTPNICTFNLINYNMTTPVELAINFGISRILDTHKNSFGFDFPGNFNAKITIYGDAKKFQAYQKKRFGKVISKTGLFTMADQEIFVWANEDTKSMVSVIFHESNHLMVRKKIPYCPKWLNEGLSEYFEGLNVIGSNKRVYLQENRSKWFKHWEKNGWPMELREYLSLSHTEWQEFHEKDSNASYTIGYSLIYFMMSNTRTEQVLKEVLWDIKRQGPRADSVATIEKHFPGGFARLNKMWLAWIPRAKTYRPLRSLRAPAPKKEAK